MKKTVLGAMVLSAVVLTSCDKLNNPVTNQSSFSTEVSSQDAMVFVSSSDYERTETEELIQSSQHGAYTAGAIEYTENGEVTNRIEFSDNNECLRSTEDGERRYDLKGKKRGEEFEKVVVEPIVKSEDCECVVAGTVEFFKEEEWVATVNFGEGECDDIATKTFYDEEGSLQTETFELKCGKEDGEKGKKGKFGKKGKKDWAKGEKKDFVKVEVEPIVKSDDCDCIVAGVVEYRYETEQDEDFVVTVDFGDGSCDNIATKSYTKEGVDYNEEFELECDK